MKKNEHAIIGLKSLAAFLLEKTNENHPQHRISTFWLDQKSGATHTLRNSMRDARFIAFPCSKASHKLLWRSVFKIGIIRHYK